MGRRNAFFRAYNYWKLMKKFGGVPKIEIALNTESPELYSERTTQKEIVDFILNDLEQAISAMPKQSEIPVAEMGRTTQGAALLLKARVALYQGTWEKYHNGSDADKYLSIAIDASKRLSIPMSMLYIKAWGMTAISTCSSYKAMTVKKLFLPKDITS